jgi:hypothetical protein
LSQIPFFEKKPHKRFYFGGKLFPTFDLENMISIYTKDFSWEKYPNSLDFEDFFLFHIAKTGAWYRPRQPIWWPDPSRTAGDALTIALAFFCPFVSIVYCEDIECTCNLVQPTPFPLPIKVACT